MLDWALLFFFYENSKQTRERIAHNYSSGIEFNDFMDLCKKFTSKAYSFLVIDNTLASDNPLLFRNNLSERI